MKVLSKETVRLKLTQSLLLHQRYRSCLDGEKHEFVVTEIEIPQISKVDVPVIKLPSTRADCDTSECDTKSDANIRVNPFNIQMLSRSLYKQIFGNVKPPPVDNNLIESCLKEMKKHNLPGALQKMPDVELKLPEILNQDLEQHFYELGRKQSEPYRILLDQLVRPIPKIPETWKFTSGWTKYTEGQEPVAVAYPEEEAVVFDVEVCCTEGESPVLATAVSNTSWYCWVSEDLCNQSKKSRKNDFYNYTTKEFVNLETAPRGKSADKDWLAKAKVVVGHHVSYDRARIKEQYFFERTGLRCVDTMSLHIATCGVTSQQKLALKSGVAKYEKWSQLTSLNNSLAEVYKFYSGKELKKAERDVFVSGSLKDIADDFANLVTYCARDVEATHIVLTHLWPTFLQRFPHPVTLAGILELTTAYLPVNRNWRRYVEDAEQTFSDLNTESKFLLSEQANKCCQLLHDQKFRDNIWLWDQEWEAKELKLKKKKKLTKKALVAQKLRDEAKAAQPIFVLKNDYDAEDLDLGKLSQLESHFQDLLVDSSSRLPKRIPYLVGYPEWYRKLCDPPTASHWKPGPEQVSTSVKNTPKLLSLTWNFMPLHRVREHGWCYVVPYKTNIALPEEEAKIFPLRPFLEHYLRMLQTGVIHEDKGNRAQIEEYLQASASASADPQKFGITCGLIKLPHKDGPELNVGNPLSRDFINKFSDEEISCNNKITRRVIEVNRQLSYWKNNKDRILGQIVVWLRGNELPSSLRGYHFGAILPQIIPCGTLTRRAVESTWMTASNADGEKVGSELRSMIQSPPGYSIIGADVDSQELWIASLLGDSYMAKEHGCTAFGWMTLSGQKADGTDMHSATANTMGISRNHAKVINYARIYGAGMSFSGRLLQQYVPGAGEAETAAKAKKMFETTKGKRVYCLRDGVLPDEQNRKLTLFQARQLCQAMSKDVKDLFERPKWMGGSESAMFNSLEEVACSQCPRTPFLQSTLSQAVCPTSEDDTSKLPTRINWVVQSSAVDFLHLMLVCMRWLIDPKTRFCLSFHDEVRYLVADKHKYSTALALHVTNLLVRSFFVKRVGMTDLPQSVAFFSCVEVDTVFRKDATADGVTPSNPHGLSKGYGIPAGEALDIMQAIEKADRKIGVHVIKSKSKGNDVN